MNTRFAIASLLALIPAGTLLAQDAAKSTITADVVAANVARPVPIPWQVAYVNCDGSKGFPLITSNDLICFLNKLAAGDPSANCDRSTGEPLITANDYQCFLNAFAVANSWQARVAKQIQLQSATAAN